MQLSFDHAKLSIHIMSPGVGSCFGFGVFILSAHVARNEAGPAVVLSVLIAGLTALLSGEINRQFYSTPVGERNCQSHSPLVR